MMRPSIFVLTCMVLLCCCQEPTTTADAPKSATTEGVVREIVGKDLQNRTCVPGVQVGPIIASSDETDLVRFFGENNVVREELIDQENMTAQSVSFVFKGKADELMIRWVQGQAYKTIESVYISGDSSSWRTPEGISIGSSLADLVRINGRDFDFYGLEWDNGGMSSSWKGGNINKNMIVYLVAANPDAVYAKGGPSGDRIFSSNLQQAKDAKLEVASMVIKF